MTKPTWIIPPLLRRYHGLIPGVIALVWTTWFFWWTHSAVQSLGGYIEIVFGWPLFLMLFHFAEVLHFFPKPLWGPISSVAIWVLIPLGYASMLGVFFAPWYSLYMNKPAITRRTSIFIAVTLAIYTVLILIPLRSFWVVQLP